MGDKRIIVNTHELSPTQPTIGRFEVSLKADRFKLMSGRDLDGYVEEKRSKGKPIQVVKGPRRYFVVDGHHTVSAILESGAARELSLDLIADYSDHDPDNFWEEMKKESWVLLEKNGRRIDPCDLPMGLDELEDDPFRSIAWLVRKMGAFEDLKAPYQEFVIADFLRAHMRFSPRAFYEYETAAIRAFEILRSDEARARAKDQPLFGFIDDDVDEDRLVERYYEVLEKARAPRHYGR